MGTNKKLAFILAICFAGSAWFYFERVLVPYQIADAAAHHQPRGNLSDLYPRWVGSRELLLHGRDPYSSEITAEIQDGYYGRPLNSSLPNDPQDQQAFAYPVYVVFLLAPFVYLRFSTVQSAFDVILWLCTALTVPLWLQALHWNASRTAKLLILILTLGSFPFVQGEKLQQLTLIVAFLLAAALAAVATRRLAVAGVLLALATIKPQLALLPVLWLMAWAIMGWRSRKPLLVSFSATMSVLLVGAQAILPGWLGEFLIAIRNYRLYIHNTSVLGWVLTPKAGDMLAALLVLASVVLCWPLLKGGSESYDFAQVLSLIMALTVVTIPMSAPYNDLLLVPPVLLLSGHFWELWRSSRSLSLVTIFVVCWPWLGSLGLVIASAVVPATELQQQWRLPLFTMLEIPLVLFAAVAYQMVKMRRISLLDSGPAEIG